MTRRLREMTARECAWRTSAALRIHADRWRYRLRPPAWNRSLLARALSPAVVDPLIRAHVDLRDWAGVHRALDRTMRARGSRFVLDPAGAAEVRSQILWRWPDAATSASRRADRIMGGRYDLLGYRGLSFAGADGRLDWHRDPVHDRRAPERFWADVPYLDPAAGDHKIIWELNRHQHWLPLGRALWLTRDRRYGWAMVTELEHWLHANPPLTGINWASMLEIGLRSISWTWALHFLLADTESGAAGPAQHPWLVDMLLALDRQLTHVEHNLSYYFSPNTHLTGEALALYVVGLSIPELAGSERWAALGRRILLDELDAQVGRDGGHAERSTHYQRYTLDFYLLALLMAERAGDGDAVQRFTDAVVRLAEFTRGMADDNGLMPLIGDDDGGMLMPFRRRLPNDIRDSLALAAVVLGRPDLAPWGVPEEVFWIAGRTAVEQEPFVQAHADEAETGSRVFADTGFAVARDDAGSHLVFDAGRHGYRNAGHAHADALAITLTYRGRPLLVDPGTCTYTMQPAVRDRFRDSRSHNTVTVNDESPSVPSGPFHWRSTTDARLATARLNPAFDWLEGWHDGFSSSQHRRHVYRTAGDEWLVVDQVLGRGWRVADAYWHFEPNWTVAADDAGRLRAVHAEGEAVWLVVDAASDAAGDRARRREGRTMDLVRADDHPGLGWYAPVYGTLVPAWTARIRQAGLAPLSIATWVEPAHQGAPEIERLEALSDPDGLPPLVLGIRQGRRHQIIMLRGDEPPVRETRECRVAEYHTDARLLHVAAADGRLLSLAVCDARHVLALREGWLSLAAETPLADLHVDVAAERLELRSSTPPAHLRLQGAAVREARRIRLNGRELTGPAGEPDDTLVVTAAQWGEPRPVSRRTGALTMQAPGARRGGPKFALERTL